MRKGEKELGNLFALLITDGTKVSGSSTEGIRNLKTTSDVRKDKKYKGAAIRARTEKLLAGEQPTERAIADEKRYYIRKQQINRIEYTGVVTKDLRTS